MRDELTPDAKPENSEKPAGASSENSNPEFENMLAEATRTKEQERQENREKNQKISDEKAAEIALSGIQGVCEMAHKIGGFQVGVPEPVLKFVVPLFCPAIKKYGNKFSLDTSAIDLNGWMPEVLALGGAGIVGVPIGLQINAQLKEKQVNGSGVESGDKSEHG